MPVAPLPRPDHPDALAMGTATLHEADGNRNLVDPAIRQLAGAGMCGPALTVHSWPGDNLAIQYAVTRSRPGDVLVISCAGHLSAGVWGDLLTQEAMARGIAGVVIDGAVRDIDHIRRLGFPLFARGTCIHGTTKTGPGATHLPLRLGEAWIHPGDLIVGDADGLVAIPSGRVETTLDKARKRIEKEEDLRTRISRGERLFDLLQLNGAPIITHTLPQ